MEVTSILSAAIALLGVLIPMVIKSKSRLSPEKFLPLAAVSAVLWAIIAGTAIYIYGAFRIELGLYPVPDLMLSWYRLEEIPTVLAIDIVLLWVPICEAIHLRCAPLDLTALERSAWRTRICRRYLAVSLLLPAVLFALLFAARLL